MTRGTVRKGLAIPFVIGILVLILPVVFTFAYRSHATLRTHARVEHQQAALDLAEEGELVARNAVAAGGPQMGQRRVSDGGMEYRVLRSGTGDLGQPVYLVAGEGIVLGEERMVVSLVEVLRDPLGRPKPLVLVHDRAWVRSERGGALLKLPELVAAQAARIRSYIDQMVAEQSVPRAQFLQRLRTQSEMLDCPDIRREWTAVEARLARAQVQ